MLAALGVASVVAIGVIQDLLKEGGSSLIKAGWRRLWGKKEALTPDRQAEAIEAVRLNVASTNKRLRDIIGHIVAGNFTSPELRGALDEVRAEFLRHRSSWVVVGNSDLLQGIEHWHDEIRRRKDDISNEEGAWLQFMNTSPVHPPEMMILPAKKRLGEYQTLLAIGEDLEKSVDALRQPAVPAPPPPSEAQRAKERLSTRMMLLSGQFDTLSHWLRGFHSLHAIEDVLVDIDKLVEGHSHGDLDIIGDPELGKVVIAFYRDVRRALEHARELAASYKRHQTLSDREQRLQAKLTECQAHSAQCSREAKQIAEQLKGWRERPS